MHSEQLLGTYGNLLNLKKHEIFDFKKTSYGRRRKKERRTKQSLDLPQTIEANKKYLELKNVWPICHPNRDSFQYMIFIIGGDDQAQYQAPNYIYLNLVT